MRSLGSGFPASISASFGLTWSFNNPPRCQSESFLISSQTIQRNFPHDFPERWARFLHTYDIQISTDLATTCKQPDQFFCNFSATKSIFLLFRNVQWYILFDRWIPCCSELCINRFWGSKIAKSSVRMVMSAQPVYPKSSRPEISRKYVHIISRFEAA